MNKTRLCKQNTWNKAIAAHAKSNPHYAYVARKKDAPDPARLKDGTWQRQVAQELGL